LKREEIQEILKKRISKIAGLCENIGHADDKEVIHQFRVSVKKLRALLRLLNSGNLNHNAKLTLSFKELYHIAGNIRDNDLTLIRLTKQKLPFRSYSDMLHSNIVHYREEWHRHYAASILEKLENKITANLPTELHPGTLNTFISVALDDLAELCEKPLLSNDEIHTIRKKMKDLFYLASFTRNYWPAAAHCFRTIDITELGKLTTIVGNFNDERFSVGHMIAFTSQDIPRSEREAMETFCNEETETFIEKKKHIIAMTKDFIGLSQAKVTP
jgi:CHAD domain-containing protein